jgi:hypothetical protein
MLHRYHIAMVRSEREQLSGVIEIDESLVGGIKKGGKRGRGTDKSIIVIAIEIKEPTGFGRIRMRHIPNASGDNLVPFVCDVVTPGTKAQTDGWAGLMVCKKRVIYTKRKYFLPTTILHNCFYARCSSGC